MTQMFLITERDELAKSIGRYLRFKEGIEISSIFPPAPPKESSNGEEQFRIGKVQWVPHTFQKLSAWIEGQAQQESTGDSALFNAVAIIDAPSLTSLAELDPIDRTKGWSAVVAMLIMAFPEIHWAIISPYDPGNTLLRKLHFPQTATFFNDLDLILQFHDEGFSPLFDPAGLRAEIRRHLALRTDASYIPLREHYAVAIDEEENYSYFNAYTAYRFGFCCHVVTSYGMMRKMLGGSDTTGIALSFEDIYLNFPDKRLSISKIRVRDREFEALTKVDKRIFVTGGHKLTTAERDTWELNDRYLNERKAQGFYSKVMFKPESGVFDVWMRSGLQQQLRASGGKAQGFVWPPRKTVATSDIGGTHSAPGRLLLIADRMIRRAGRILKNAESVPEAVHGATLTLEAQEYLGHRTPTTSLDAVALKHQLEVLAECMFYGVEYHLDTKSRFREIEQEVESIGIWFRSHTREVSKLNAEIGMLSDLVLSFRNFNQFNEEQAGLSKLRHLYRQLWFERNKSWAWLVYPARWYIDHLLSSIAVFIAALSAWLLVFGGIYAFIPHSPPGIEVESAYTHGLEDAVVTFFGMQPPHELFQMEGVRPIIIWISMMAIIMSFVHLGIFVSHLYSIIARR
jgi:hypothetical protein